MLRDCYLSEGDGVVYVCEESTTLFVCSVCPDVCVVRHFWCFVVCSQFSFLYCDYIYVVSVGYVL